MEMNPQPRDYKHIFVNIISQTVHMVEERYKRGSMHMPLHIVQCYILKRNLNKITCQYRKQTEL